MVVSSRRRPQVLRRPLAVVASSVGLSLACSSSIDPRTFEVDCAENGGYEFDVLQEMEGTTAPWFNFGDTTPGATNAIALQPIAEGRCGSTAALVLTARGHTDWGAGFGEYDTAVAPVDASEYEGVSLWARVPRDGMSTGFLLTLHDRNTSAAGMICTEPVVTNVTGGAYTFNPAGMAVPVGGELPAPTDCGNGFVRVVTVTRQWQLYLLPFESFQQLAQPNRNPNGLDKTGLYQFAINIPKDSIIELWIDDLGLYRHRGDMPEAAGSAER
jgi:hypothetical protein